MNNSFSGRDIFIVSVSVSCALISSVTLDFWLGSTIAVLLIMQLSIVVIAFKCPSVMAYIAAVLEALCFNYLFTAPRYSFEMFQSDDILNLVVFLIVAFTTSQLAMRFRLHQSIIGQVQMRNRILLSVSHDLRTPLAAIIGNLSTFQEYQSKLNDDQKQELLNSATTESHRLHHYIENLLQATKQTHGEVYVSKTTESAINIVERVIARFSRATPNIELHADRSLVLLPLNRALIEQALFNVLDNALRYSPKNIPVSISLMHQSDGLIIDIYNQGETPTAEDAEHMFELFYSTANSDSGTGLGLSVAKGIITAHQGSIACVRVDHGCLIRITLPVLNEGDC